MTPLELFSDGRLGEAIAASAQDVKKRPADINTRSFFCQLLCIAGQLDRADAQLETIETQLVSSESEGPGTGMWVRLFRHLVGAEKWRREFYSGGHAPEFIAPPPEHIQLHLRASIALREGNPAEALAMLQAAADVRPTISGVCNGEPFEGLIDANDMTASFLEVLASNGSYYWVPFESIDQIRFQKPKRPLDMLWRSATMSTVEGPEVDVYVPAIYADIAGDLDECFLLGRETDWKVSDGMPAQGMGQRILIFGEVDRPMLEIDEVRVAETSPCVQAE